jgi:hypothetical protein
MKLQFDSEAMRVEVLKYLSIGMPIENAKRIMEDSGFKCHDSWWVADPSCVDCLAVYAAHFMFSDEIRVFVYHEAGHVTDIKVECYSIGP